MPAGQVEAFDEVERAFVHVDWAHRDEPEHKACYCPWQILDEVYHASFRALLYKQEPAKVFRILSQGSQATPDMGFSAFLTNPHACHSSECERGEQVDRNLALRSNNLFIGHASTMSGSGGTLPALMGAASHADPRTTASQPPSLASLDAQTVSQ